MRNRHRLRSSLFVGVCLLTASSAQAQVADAIPPSFEENVGQAGKGVAFYQRGAREVVLVGHDGWALVVPTTSGDAAAVMRAKLVDAQTTVIEPEGWTAARSNYLHGPREAWVRGVRHTALLVQQNVYPRIDLVYRAGAPLRFEFVVQPGGSPKDIRFDVNAKHIELIGESAILTNDGLSVELGELFAYQDVGGLRRPVDVRFVVDKRGLGFVVGAYDRRRPLVIDPSVRYSALFGGTSYDTPRGIGIDAAGLIYVGGVTYGQSTTFMDFPTTPDAFARMPNTRIDTYVVRLDPTQTGTASLQFATYFGAAEYQSTNVMTVDPTGRVVLAGGAYNPDEDAPPLYPTPGAYEAVEGRWFAARLNPAGNDFEWYTRFAAMWPNDIALASDGRVALVGGVGAEDEVFRVKHGPATPFFDGEGIIEFDPSQRDDDQLVYSAIFPSFGDSRVAYGPHDVPYIMTRGLELRDHPEPTTPGVVSETQPYHQSPWLARIDTSLRENASVELGTYVPIEYGRDFTIDAAGNVIVVGGVTDSDPATFGSASTTRMGRSDAVIMALSPDFSTIQYATYLGLAERDLALWVHTDDARRVYVVGQGDLPITSPVACAGLGAVGRVGPFVARLSPNGSRIVDIGNVAAGQINTYATALGPNGVIYVAGTFGGEDPWQPGGFHSTTGFSDTWVTAFSTGEGCADLELMHDVVPAQVTGSATVTFSVTVSNAGATPATEVEVTSALPPELVVTGVSSSQGTCVGMSEVVCSVGVIAATATVTVHIEARPRASGTFTVAATVDAATPDADYANQSASATLVVAPPTNPCGFVGAQAECSADELRRCIDLGGPSERLETTDCATHFGAGSTGVCGLHEIAVGNECLVALDNVCAIVSNPAPCDGIESGCITPGNGSEARCRAEIGVCDPSTFVPVCRTGRLLLGCQRGQAAGFDCAEAGGTCANASCSALPLGAPCDGVDLLCATGHNCTAGRCAVIPPPSSPSPSPTPSVDEPTPESGGCTASGEANLGALIVLVLFARRRFVGAARRRLTKRRTTRGVTSHADSA